MAKLQRLWRRDHSRDGVGTAEGDPSGSTSRVRDEPGDETGDAAGDEAGDAAPEPESATNVDASGTSETAGPAEPDKSAKSVGSERSNESEKSGRSVDPDRPSDTDSADSAGTDIGATADTDDDTADAETDAEPDPDVPAQKTGAVARVRDGGGRFNPREWLPVVLIQAGHPKQAIVLTLAAYGATVATDRPLRESVAIVAAVLVGQLILGWHNDLVDAPRDRTHEVSGKPIADGRLSRANAWTALIVGWLLLVPLSVMTGLVAGGCYLGAVAAGMLGNVLFRTTPLSVWSWALSFGLFPAYLSYGGWGGRAEGPPPEIPIIVLSGLVGIGVHFVRSVWGLVADHEDGWTYLPLRLALKLGATRLLVLAGLYLVVAIGALVITAADIGLSR